MSPVRSGLRLWRAVPGAVSALLLLLGTAGPSPAEESTSAEESQRLTAILLVARTELRDSDFAGAVVLVMNNLGPAPIGVVINRPTQVPVSRLFPDLKRLAPLHDKVYFGGPVDFGTVWFLFRASRAPEHAVKALEGIYLSANRKLLVQLLGRDKPMDGLRIFIGHSGWAPGQLESEIARGDWALQHAGSEAIFNGKSERPWPEPQSAKPST